MFREDFLMTNDYIYFDNAATTLKPTVVSDITTNYYTKYTSNVHRGSYDVSAKVDSLYEDTRVLVKDLINAEKVEEIVFTSGTTDSLNKLVFGYFKNHLKENDEIIITKTEHASNVLPWFELAKELNLKVNYIPLNEDNSVTLDNLKKVVTKNTKVISLAYITNVIGDIRPAKEIVEFAHDNNILVTLDAAQAVGHIKVDVKDLDIDFLAFSSHKMCGPTGVGVLYGKYELLSKTKPIIFGGDMNADFDSNCNVEYLSIPKVLEAGTPNIAGVIGLSEAIKYLNKIGINEIDSKIKELTNYALDKLKNIKDIKIYNSKETHGIITFNISDIHPQDIALYLNKYNICIRVGEHCSRMTDEVLDKKKTCRMSLYFYNTKEEIDKMFEVLNV